MSTPTPVYVTHKEVPYDLEENVKGNRIAQLRVGPHVVLEVPFYADSAHCDEEAASEIADALHAIFDPIRKNQ